MNHLFTFKRLGALGFTSMLAALCLQAAESLPSYTPGQSVSGIIRIVGDDYAAIVVKNWQEGFQKYHPQAKIEANLQGSGTGLAGIYTGVADLALIGRPINPVEHDAYSFIFNKTDPFSLEAMTGSLDVSDKSPALVAFVNKDNPLGKITLAQLEGIIGTENKCGLGDLHTWGQLGLTGEWADKPIKAYVYDAKTGTGLFLNKMVLKDSSKWRWDRVKEFKDIKWNADGYAYDSGKQIIDALAKDRYGIAISSLRYANSKVKALALAAKEGEPYYEATRENLTQRKYPLTRTIDIYISRPPGKPLDPKLKEFLRYIFSQEGQDAVVREGGFLPLSAEAVNQQLKKLE